MTCPQKVYNLKSVTFFKQNKFNISLTLCMYKKRLFLQLNHVEIFIKGCLFANLFFTQNAVPINPFNLFGYFLYKLVERDIISNAINNIFKKCDELWVFGEISDGVLFEISYFKTPVQDLFCLS